MIKITKMLTPYNYTKMHKKKNEFIVIHYVGAVSTAENNAKYYASKMLSASAHYFVDEGSIYQCVEDSNRSWHCGGNIQGNAGHTYHGICTNSNSIGVEMCCKLINGVWCFDEQTVENTADLVKNLMKKHSIPISNVIRHYDVTGKHCPQPYVNETEWSKFKARLIEYITPVEAVDVLIDKGIITEGDKWYQGTWNDNDFKWLLRKVGTYLKNL